MDQIVGLKLEQTKNTPEIRCEYGLITICGNSILENPVKYFKPLQDWTEDYLLSPAPITTVTLKFLYINTSSVLSIFDLLKLLKDKIPNSSENLIVNFYFEFDDPELLELGEIMAGRLDLDFNFTEYNLEE